MITNLLTGRIYLTELGGIASFTSNAVKTATIEDPRLTKLLGELDDINGKFGTVVMMSHGGTMTEEVAEASNNAGKGFTCFKTLEKALTHCPDATIANNSEVLYSHLKTFGKDVTSKGSVEKIAKLDAIYTELDQPHYQTIINDLGIMAYYTIAKTALDTFKTILKKSREADAEKDQLMSATELKPILLEKLDKLYDYLNMVVDFEPEMYTPLCLVLNEHIEKMNAQLRARATRKENTNLHDEDAIQDSPE